MGWPKSLAVLVAVILMLLLALTVAVFTLDLGRFKPLIVSIATDTLEREVAIDGTLSIDVGKQIHVVAEGIRVASEPWTEQPNLVAVEAVEVRVDTWSLVKGTALVDDFSASGIRAHLAADDAGNNNWTFAKSEEEESETMPVIFRQGKVTDALLAYQDPALAVKAVVDQLSLSEDDEGGLDFDLAGAFNDAPLAVTGNMGTLDNLIAGTDVVFSVTGEIGEIIFDGSGWIDELAAPRKPRLAMSVTGPNAEYLTGLLGLDPVTTGPLNFNASVTDAAGMVAVNVQGNYGEFKLDLNGKLQDLQSLDSADVTLSAEGPSLDTIGRVVGQSGFPEHPYSMQAALTLQNEALTVEQFLFDVGRGKLAATATFPQFPSPEGAQARLNASGPEFGDFNKLFGLPGKLTGPFELIAALERTASGGDIDAQLEAQAFQVRVEGALSDHPELVGSQVSVAVTGDDAAAIAAALEVDGVPAEPFGARADLALTATAIEITEGALILGPETIVLAGTINRDDPLSSQTRLQLSTEVDDLKGTAARFGLDAEQIPAGPLALRGEIGRGEGAYLLDGLTVTHPDIELRLDASFGDSLAPSDLRVNFTVSGRDLAKLVPAEEGMLAGEAFRATGNIGFSAEDTVLLQGLEAEYGPATAQVSATFSLADPTQAGEASISVEAPSLTTLVPGMREYLPEDDALKVNGGGRWQEEGIWLQDTTIALGEANIEVRGEVHAPPEIAGTALTVTASIPSLKPLEAVAGQTLPEGALSFSGELVAEADEFRMPDFNLLLGENDLAGRLAYRPATDESVARVTADFQSRYLDLRPLQALAAEEPSEAAPLPDDGRLIPNTPLPLETLRSQNAEVRFQGERVLFDNGDLSDVRLSASLTEGALVVDEFALTGENGGTLFGALELLPAGQGADLRFEMDGANLIIGLPAKSAEDRQLLPKYEVSTRLAATGTTTRELAASSRGYLRLVADEGEIALGGLGFLMQDFAGEVFESINPMAKKETHSQVQCLAVLVEINDGVVEGKPAVVFQTDKLNITGVGRVDLGSEKLNAKFNTTARKGIGIGISDLVSPLTEVGGTLGSPRLQLNTANAIVEGGAAVATVGMSFVAKKMRNRLFSDKSPCRTAIAKADEDLAEGGVPLSEPPR